MIDVKDTAQKVIDLLNRDGWTKVFLKEPDGTAMCLFGALNTVLHGDYHWYWSGDTGAMDVQEFSDALLPVLARMFPDKYAVASGLDHLSHYAPGEQSRGVLVEFNNAASTTKEDVIGVLQGLVAA